MLNELKNAAKAVMEVGNNKTLIMKKWIRYKENGKEMWCFGEEEGKYCIGLDSNATILATKDQVIFLE